MKDKRMTLPAAAALVHDGDQIVMEGKGHSPMALLRELVRQGRKTLRLAGVVGSSLNVDLLVGAGTAQSVDTCSVTLWRFARTGPNFQRYVQEGRIKAFDNT